MTMRKILIIFLLLTSCQSEELDIILDFLKNEHYVYSYETFDFIVSKQHSLPTTYEFIFLSADTDINISLTYKDEKSIVLTEYYKIYKEKEKYVKTQFSDNFDTLFIFKSPDAIMDQKDFVMGKYLYLYLNDYLSLGQKKFFEVHQDSLKLIRGNDLAPLPTMN